jgi:hypothetical protein
MSQERVPQVPREERRHVETLDALLRAHQDMKRGRLFLHFGEAFIERLAGYVEGYRACMREIGLEDGRYERFCVWLRHAKQVQPVEESPTLYLRALHGDHEQAIRTYLDFVEEFAASPLVDCAPAQPEAASSPRGGRTATGILKYLLRVRQDLQRGQLRLHVREMDAQRFNTFVDGYNACMEFNGLADGQYGRFRDWLRDEKKEFPGEGWPVAYLRMSHGDPERAISRYLDFVAEFVDLFPQADSPPRE